MLAHWGVLDFAGGIVVHAIAGFAALASVIYVGKRRIVDAPHNLPLIALGTGLLWFGWYGFNAGSELKVDEITATAFLNTDIAASFAAITWLFVEWGTRRSRTSWACSPARSPDSRRSRPRRYVSIDSAVIIGVASGVVCYYAITLKNRFQWDDALDVWGVHGVGGFLGIVLLGVFASKSINPNGATGLIHGSGTFFGKQLAAATEPPSTPSRSRS